MNLLPIASNEKISVYTVGKMNTIQRSKYYRGAVCDNDPKKIENIRPFIIAQLSQSVSSLCIRITIVINRLT